MFIKRTSPKDSTVKVSKNLSKCSKCGTPMLGHKITKLGSAVENDLICSKCECGCEDEHSRVKSR